MLKLSKNHTIYEVWNEWASESVFINHRPSKNEVLQLIFVKKWTTTFSNCSTIEKFIKKYIHIEKLQDYYVGDIINSGIAD